MSPSEPRIGGVLAAQEPCSYDPPERPARPHVVRPRLSHAVIVWAIVAVLIPASRVVSSSFPSWNQVESILILGSFLTVAAYGEGLVVLSGGFDLSIPSLITAAGMTAAAYTERGGNVAAAIVLALLVSTAIGGVSGIGVGYLGVSPVIMTLATGTIVAGALLGLNSGAPSRPSPAFLHHVFGTGRAGGIPIVIFFFAGFVLCAILLQQASTHGRRIYAVGNGARVALLSGIPVSLVTASVYAIAGLCYGIAGLMLTGYTSGAELSLGGDYLLPAIAAVVVGGVSIRGGRGSAIGVVGGALLLTTVGNDISATTLAQGWKQVLYGAIVLGALLASGGRLARLRARRP